MLISKAIAASAPTTRPVLTPLEIQMVFPGAVSQGQPSSRIHPPAECELVNLKANNGTKITALFGKAIGVAHARASIVYFYGNGMCLADCVIEFNRLRRLGMNVIVPDYEGYGLSEGSPSEPGCYSAGDAAFDYLLTRKDVDRQRMVVMGWSIGGAVAMELATRREVAGLITISTFTNIAEESRALTNRFAIPLISKFDNLAKIGTVKCPIFMSHGMKDEMVPPEMLERLAKAAKSKVTITRIKDAGHNDIFKLGGDGLYHSIEKFVEGLPNSNAGDVP